MVSAWVMNEKRPDSETVKTTQSLKISHAEGRFCTQRKMCSSAIINGTKNCAQVLLCTFFQYSIYLFVSPPGFEPGLPRPQRGVLTTIRWRRYQVHAVLHESYVARTARECNIVSRFLVFLPGQTPKTLEVKCRKMVMTRSGALSAFECGCVWFHLRHTFSSERD